MPNDGVSRLENAKSGASVDSSRLSADKSRVDRGDENRSTAIESMVIVWPSADLSAIVGTPWESMEMVRSLEEAIVLANRNSRIQSIQIASNSLKCGPVKIERKGLKLSAANGFQPTLIWKDDSASEKPTSRSKELGAWFDIGENDLWVEGIQFETRDIGRGFAMFRAIGAANMTFVRCAASIENLSNDHSATFFLSESRSGLSITTDDEVLASSMPTGDPLQLTAEDCIFRGEASWFLSRTAMRSEIRCTNCMIAVQDWMLDLIGTNIPTRNLLAYRLELEQSTIACGRSMVRIMVDLQRPYGVRLSRESIDCAYWLAPGSSLVEVRGGIDELQAEEMLDLRGDDNAYDEGIEFFATVQGRNGEMVRYESRQMDGRVVRERGSENLVRWLQPQPPDLPFSRRRPTDYRQRPGNFSPGVDESRLPFSAISLRPLPGT